MNFRWRSNLGKRNLVWEFITLSRSSNWAKIIIYSMQNFLFPGQNWCKNLVGQNYIAILFSFRLTLALLLFSLISSSGFILLPVDFDAHLYMQGSRTVVGHRARPSKVHTCKHQIPARKLKHLPEIPHKWGHINADCWCVICVHSSHGGGRYGGWGLLPSSQVLLWLPGVQEGCSCASRPNWKEICLLALLCSLSGLFDSLLGFGFWFGRNKTCFLRMFFIDCWR